MAQRGRPGLSNEQKAEVWQRWRGGESFSDIGRALYKSPGSIFGVLKLNGGILPAKRQRSKLALTLLEREEISRGLASGHSMRQIAEELGRSASTISREVNRHGGINKYRATNANERAWELPRRPKTCYVPKMKNCGA